MHYLCAAPYDGAPYHSGQAPISQSYIWSCNLWIVADLSYSVHFPGAVNSKFTTKLSFERPSTHATIPTFRVMDSDGLIVDKDRDPPDVSDEEVLTWYKNMLTGASFSTSTPSLQNIKPY